MLIFSSNETDFTATAGLSGDVWGCLFVVLNVTAVKQSENNILMNWFTEFLGAHAPSHHSLSNHTAHNSVSSALHRHASVDLTL